MPARLQNDFTLRTRHARLRISDSGGDGTPILLLHGTGSTRHAFLKQFESDLASRHRLVAPDLPGHGESTDAVAPELDYTLGGFTSVVANVIDLLGLTKVVVYGWSLGGHIGIELLQNPAVAGLMIGGAPPTSKGPLGMLRAFQPSWDMLLASKERYSDRDVLRFHELCFPNGSDPVLLEAVRRADGRARSILVKSLMRGDGSDQRRAVEEAHVPVAIVNGSDEPFVRLGYLDGIHSPALWKGAPQVIDGAGHAPFWDRPAIFNALLGQFTADAAAFAERAPPRAARTA